MHVVKCVPGEAYVLTVTLRRRSRGFQKIVSMQALIDRFDSDCIDLVTIFGVEGTTSPPEASRATVDREATLVLSTLCNRQYTRLDRCEDVHAKTNRPATSAA